MCDYSKFISNIVITLYCKERKELLKMALRRMLYQAPIMEESVADIFTENPYPCPFYKIFENYWSGIWNCQIKTISLLWKVDNHISNI